MAAAKRPEPTSLAPSRDKPGCDEAASADRQGHLRFQAGLGKSARHGKAWRNLFADYRRRLKTFLSSFRAAIGLYFFKETFAYASLRSECCSKRVARQGA